MPSSSRKQATPKRTGKGYPRRRKDLSQLEDSPRAYQVLKRIGMKAGKEAAERALSLGHSIVFLDKDGTIVRQSPDGKKTKVKPHVKRASFYVKYSRNAVIHAVKK